MTLLQRVTGALVLAMIWTPGLYAKFTEYREREPAVREVRSATAEDMPAIGTQADVAAPAFVIIPDLTVSTVVERAGLTEDNQMENPTTWETVAWYGPGVKPGENGHAVIAGHLDSDTGPAVFWDLRSLGEGDEVIVIDTHGTRRMFAVTYLAEFDNKNVPMQNIFGPAPEPRIVLITCEGDWRGDGYSKRLAVYAKLISEEPALPGVL